MKTLCKLLPKKTLLQRLILHDNGFVFDPVSGYSFTTNESGLALLSAMTQHATIPAIIGQLADEWLLEPRRIEQDLLAFVTELRTMLRGCDL